MSTTPQPRHFRFTDSRIRWSNDERDDPTCRSPSTAAHQAAAGDPRAAAAETYLSRGAPTTSSARTSPVRPGDTGTDVDAAPPHAASGRVVPMLSSNSGSEREDKAGPLRVMVPVSQKTRHGVGSQSSLGSLPAVEPTPHHMHLHPTTVLAASSRKSTGGKSQVGFPRSFIGSNRTARRASVQLELLGNPYDIPSSSIPEGKKKPWRWDLSLWDKHLEAEWQLLLYRTRRLRTWRLEALGVCVFLFLVFTDIGAALFAGDSIDDFTWWKAAFRLGVGALAGILLALEQAVKRLRRYWMGIRSFNVLLCCLWAVVFAPVGGLAELLDSSAIAASCSGPNRFKLQEIRLHPAVFLLLFAGPVLDARFVHVFVVAVLSIFTEVALALASSLHGNLFVVFDQIGVAVLLVGASVATAYNAERSGRALFLQNRKLHKENIKLNQVLSMRGLSGDDETRTTIVSNSEKMLELLQRVLDKIGDDDDLHEALELMQGGGGLFAPDLTNLELSDKVEAPIKEWLLTGPARLGDQRRHVRRKATSIVPQLYVRAKTSASFGNHVPSAATPISAVSRFLATVDFAKFNFDVLELVRTTPKVLSLIGESVVKSFELDDAFNLDSVLMHKFFSRLDVGYVSSNPYHNALHGASVTWDMQYYLRVGCGERFLTRVEVLGCIIAAACHDFKHPGKNNQFLITTRDEIAVMYNDQSVLENFHSAETFKLGTSTDCPLFLQLDSTDNYQRFREVVISMVLATDVSKHFTHVAKLKTKSLATPTGSEEALGKVADVDLLVISLIMLCDLGHAAKEFDLHCRWTELVTEEFFRQGDAEKQLGVKVSPLCDRETTNLAKSQIGFFDFLVLPLFESFARARMVYQFDPILKTARRNQAQWKVRMSDPAHSQHTGSRTSVGGPPVMLAVDDGVSSVGNGSPVHHTTTGFDGSSQLTGVDGSVGAMTPLRRGPQLLAESKNASSPGSAASATPSPASAGVRLPPMSKRGWTSLPQVAGSEDDLDGDESPGAIPTLAADAYEVHADSSDARASDDDAA